MDNRVYVKEWLVRKNLGILSNEYFAAKEVDFEFSVVKETEKAVNGYFDTAYGRVYMWAPKSQLQTIVEKVEEDNIRMNKYEEVLNFAKSNGLKVRKGMKLATIKSKIAEAGLILK